MRFWFYLLRAAWRVTNGRWYVWRDAPYDIVRQVATLWFHARHEQGDVAREVIQQAYSEHLARKRRADHAAR